MERMETSYMETSYEELLLQKEADEIINLFRKGEISPYRDYFTYIVAKRLNPLLPNWVAVDVALTRPYPPSADPNP